ncbi:MAG: RNA polymerase sigma factor [Bacteroidota bacterium]|nr:RNA polymerase sigma factor [Bacteroidota bacterium]
MGKKEDYLAAINENRDLILKVASLYTNSKEDRNDVVQEIQYQLWKSFTSFQERSSIRTWMYRVAMNVAIYQLKIGKRKIRSVPLEEDLIAIQVMDDDGYEEKWQLLKSKINQLNLLEKGILFLYLENRSYGEIAQIIGISASNVGTRLSRIKEKLREQIQNNPDHGIR